MAAQPDWRALFGHPTPYEVQVDGIETALEVGQQGGYLALEGACGTGKTMLALTAGLSLVRDTKSDFERVLVLTSVKQQLRQFESDLQAINAGLETPVAGLTLVGKADLCPYVRSSAGELTETTIYDRCDQLRETTRGLVEETRPAELTAQARARDSPTLQVAKTQTPFRPDLPAAEPNDEVAFCPFYAQYLDDLPEDGDRADAVPFETDRQGLLDTETLIARSVANGTCPHSMLTALIEDSEVVIGNYYHAFDPLTTATVTGALLDETTYVICDEAHMLEPRVRELLGEECSEALLQRATGEIDRVAQLLRTGAPERGSDAETAQAELAETETTREDLTTTRQFLRALREHIETLVETHLNQEHPGWDQPGPASDRPATVEIPLRDPETPACDALTDWAHTEEDTDDPWAQAEAVCGVVDRILEALDEDTDASDRATPTVGRVLGAWGRHGHEQFFRTIELTERAHPQSTDTWRGWYTARLKIHNCVPGEAIGEQLGAFGGGIVMSATLEPIEVFTAVTGLDHLAETADRPVVTRQYGLQFPADNRASFAVAAPRFTYSNRGTPVQGDTLDAAGGNNVRAVYADAIRSVADAPGNVLVCMPSYREAEWAAEILATHAKPVLCDTASDEATTQALKESFFQGPGKVLVTSLRGTLTEGVDYSGDRLAAAVVCGVPIVDTASPQTRAIRAAYDRAFGDSGTDDTGDVGFEYALAIPAVRKARQALGRVIRGQDDVGVRVLVDERYARASWDSLREYIPAEFQTVSPDMLELGLKQFWAQHTDQGE